LTLVPHNSTRISNELGAGCPNGAYLAAKVTLFIAFTCGVLHNVWFYGKIRGRKESGWKEPLSIVWYHHKKERKESLCWDPLKIPFPSTMDGKWKMCPLFGKKT
jgi:hypothetical protein